MSAAAASPLTFSEAWPRGAEKGGGRPFFLSRTRNEPESKPLRTVRPAGALRHRCRGARRRAPRVDAAGDARERSLSDLEVAVAASCVYAAIARRGSGVRDEYGDAARVPDGTVELARTHRSRVRRTPSPASVASRLARRELENL